MVVVWVECCRERSERKVERVCGICRREVIGDLESSLVGAIEVEVSW